MGEQEANASFTTLRAIKRLNTINLILPDEFRVPIRTISLKINECGKVASKIHVELGAYTLQTLQFQTAWMEFFKRQAFFLMKCSF